MWYKYRGVLVIFNRFTTCIIHLFYSERNFVGTSYILTNFMLKCSIKIHEFSWLLPGHKVYSSLYSIDCQATFLGQTFFFLILYKLEMVRLFPVCLVCNGITSEYWRVYQLSLRHFCSRDTILNCLVKHLIWTNLESTIVNQHLNSCLDRFT